MHEFSLVQNMLEQVSSLAGQHQARRVLRIRLTIGPLSGVAVDSFRFGFQALASTDPLFATTELIIEEPPRRYTCSACGFLMEENQRPPACPQCREPLLIPGGSSELLLEQVEME